MEHEEEAGSPARTFPELLTCLAEEHQAEISRATHRLRAENANLATELQELREAQTGPADKAADTRGVGAPAATSSKRLVVRTALSHQAANIGSDQVVQVHLPGAVQTPRTAGPDEVCRPPPLLQRGSSGEAPREPPTPSCCCCSVSGLVECHSKQLPSAVAELQQADIASGCHGGSRLTLSVMAKRDSLSNDVLSMVKSRRTSICSSRRSSQGSMASGKSEDAVSSRDSQGHMELRQVWKRRASPRKSSMASSASNYNVRATTGRRRSLGKLGTPIQLRNVQTTSLWDYICANIVTSPSSSTRLAWDIFGAFLIGYDLIVIPTQSAFDLPATPVSVFMAWLTVCFWTLDIPCSLLTGFHQEGLVETRFLEVVRHYVRTWFVFDVLVVTIDWGLLLFSMRFEGDVGYVQMGRILRFLRVIRLVRLLKVQGVVSDLADRIKSDYCLVMFGIAKLILVILLINHHIACIWYGLGTVGDGQGKSWVITHGLHEQGFIYRYATSMHWSLTQFTPASMEVYPTTAAERAFTLGVLVFAMVTFSSFISSITNAMTQLRNLDIQRLEQQTMLRRYLGENRVSAALMSRIWGCMKQAMDKSKQRIHEEDVEGLRLLPSSLRADLHDEIYTPVIVVHPFFMLFSSTYPQRMRRIYQTALEEMSLGIGQELLHSGEEAQHMYFVVSGILSYLEDSHLHDTEDAHRPPFPVTSGQWLCEAVLWINWRHAGQAVATTNCELIAFPASKISTVLECEVESAVYAWSFHEYLSSHRHHVNDVNIDVEALRDLAQQAFTFSEPNERSLTSVYEAPAARHGGDTEGCPRSGGSSSRTSQSSQASDLKTQVVGTFGGHFQGIVPLVGSSRPRAR